MPWLLSRVEEVEMQNQVHTTEKLGKGCRKNE